VLRQLEQMRLHLKNAWEFTGVEGSVMIDMRPGDRTTIGFIGMPGDAGAASRFSVVERQEEKVLGGSVFLFRPEADDVNRQTGESDRGT
jgi:hypothetical protein